MEVASPISFTPVQAGTKRPYVCSPLMEASGPVSNMDVSEDSMLQPNLKRRRFAANDSTQHSTSAASMIFGVGLGSRSPFATVSGNKRSRIDADVDKVVQDQANEIENLKSERTNLQISFRKLKEDHEKVVTENRILKRAVTIQQERQNQAATEIEAASRYKIAAEDRVRKLEQLIITLRYHLQAQNTNAAVNDFMGMPPRPPDVY